MMKVSAFTVIAVSLVVGVISSSNNSSYQDPRLLAQQCTEEIGFNSATSLVRRERCISACVLEKRGLMKDGKLEERQKLCDTIADTMTRFGEPLRPKEGRTFHQLAEKCYDEANAQTDKCEIAYVLGNCIVRGLERTSTSTMP